MAVDFSKAKVGDKFRRIEEGLSYLVQVGDIFTYRGGNYNELRSDRNGYEMGTAIESAWEQVKSEEEPILTAQTVNAADLLAKLEALTKEVAKFVAQEKAGKPSGRQRVIEKAKAEVRYEEQRRVRGHYTPIEFHVNERKGTVVALRRSVGGEVIHVGKAKVSRDDKFDVHIGKAIAMRRALGQGDEPTYLNAPQH